MREPQTGVWHWEARHPDWNKRQDWGPDTLIDRGDGLEFPTDWVNDEPERVLERLRLLLELPVELVLPTHGKPTDRAALERALS